MTTNVNLINAESFMASACLLNLNHCIFICEWNKELLKRYITEVSFSESHNTTFFFHLGKATDVCSWKLLWQIWHLEDADNACLVFVHTSYQFWGARTPCADGVNFNGRQPGQSLKTKNTICCPFEFAAQRPSVVVQKPAHCVCMAPIKFQACSSCFFIQNLSAWK